LTFDDETRAVEGAGRSVDAAAGQPLSYQTIVIIEDAYTHSAVEA
jgi:hypothetical protein